MKRILLLVVFVLALAGYVTLQILLAPPQPEPQLATFPDGSQVEFLGAAQGGTLFRVAKGQTSSTKTSLTLGPIYSPVPERSGFLRFWERPSVLLESRTDRNSIMMFFRGLETSGSWKPWTGYYAEDDDGFRYTVEDGSSPPAYFAADIGDLVIGLSLASYPRRQPAFDLVFCGSKMEEIARFRVANSAAGSYSVGQPQPLPIGLTNHPAVLTLKAMQWRPDRIYDPFDATFDWSTTDPAWANARVGIQTVEDPTGNSGNYASPHEPVWRLRTFVRREWLEDLKPSELLVLTNLAIPHLALGQELAEVGLVSPLGGGKIEILGFIPPYDRPENEIPPFGTKPLAASAPVVLNPEPGDGKATGKARLVVDIAGLTAADAVIWRSHQGRIDDVKIIEGGGGVIRLDPGERRYVVDLSGLTNDVIDRIEIGISRALSFEFLVNPRDVEGLFDDSGKPVSVGGH